jgi:hypothetical protein
MAKGLNKRKETRKPKKEAAKPAVAVTAGKGQAAPAKPKE